jgi:hypothetical protein
MNNLLKSAADIIVETDDDEYFTLIKHPVKVSGLVLDQHDLNGLIIESKKQGLVILVNKIN